jgi:hypothetical protein
MKNCQLVVLSLCFPYTPNVFSCGHQLIKIILLTPAFDNNKIPPSWSECGILYMNGGWVKVLESPVEIDNMMTVVKNVWRPYGCIIPHILIYKSIVINISLCYTRCRNKERITCQNKFKTLCLDS